MLFTAKYKLFLHRETFKKGFLYIFRYHFDATTAKSGGSGFHSDECDGFCGSQSVDLFASRGNL
jgi:hypothetical protein